MIPEEVKRHGRVLGAHRINGIVEANQELIVVQVVNMREKIGRAK